MTTTKNWETLSNTGWYLTAQDTLNEEGHFTRVKKSEQGGLTLDVGYVTTFELMDIKARFPHINIVSK
jgi:hypothetical protein